MGIETRTVNIGSSVIKRVRLGEVDVTIYCKTEPDDYTITTIANVIKNKMEVGVVNKNKVQAGLADALKDKYTVELTRIGSKKEDFTWSVHLS